MHTLRKYLSWSFAFTSLVCLQVAFSITLRTIPQPHTFRLLLLVAPLMMIAFAAVFGLAWWTEFKGKPSARGWGIAASLINIQVSLFPIIFPPHSVWNIFLPILGLGVAGLLAFSRRLDPSDSIATTHENLGIPGDGTINLVNRTIQFLMLLALVGAYFWWIGWLRAKGVSTTPGNWYPTLVAVLLGLVIVALHEGGHTAVGVLLGMKLRAFIIGPFQWRICDGRWEFQFEPKQILTPGGVTGVVPTVTNFPRWAHLCMLAAGVFANVFTGVLALWAAYAADGNSPVQAGGFLALFGAWNLVIGAMNLVPFRTKDNYSDGAQIYQVLSNGPWGDFHRLMLVGGSSLVTPLRPRNYDIEAIHRAGRTINQGRPALLLRLLAYNHFLDQDRIPEAAEALGEAGLIYNQSASDVPAELFTAFVFGSAYIWRDAGLARQWWTQMEARKPTRFNVDYWFAASALHWIEGNLKDANESWERANTLAQPPPKVGAYDFDRHCCSLLRKALDQGSAATNLEPVRIHL
jgi:peptidase M50-like protein